MSSRAIAAAALTLVALALLIVEIASWSASARFGPLIQNTSRCTVGIVALNGADRASGLREGDSLLLTQMDEPGRLAMSQLTPMQVARTGETTRLVVQRGDHQLSLPYTFHHTDGVGRFLAQLGFKFVIIAVGLLVLWRGRDRASLILGVWCVGVAVALPDAWWGGLPFNGRLVGSVLTASLWTYSPFVLYLVVESIATGVGTRAKTIARILMAITVGPSLIVNALNTATETVIGCAPVFLDPSLLYS